MSTTAETFTADELSEEMREAFAHGLEQGRREGQDQPYSITFQGTFSPEQMEFLRDGLAAEWPQYEVRFESEACES